MSDSAERVAAYERLRNDPKRQELAERVQRQAADTVAPESLTTDLERRLYNALVDIDLYLAHDPLVWRLENVSKAGDVLCDILGPEVIGRINDDALRYCPYCGEAPILEES
jgi:hypothetical protein